MNWKNAHSKALYLSRFGVNVDYLRQGFGNAALQYAITIAKQKNASYLRLFAVDINKPAINLYLKNGFYQVEGIYEQRIDDELTLHEYGFELKIKR